MFVCAPTLPCSILFQKEDTFTICTHSVRPQPEMDHGPEVGRILSLAKATWASQTIQATKTIDICKWIHEQHTKLHWLGFHIWVPQFSTLE